MRLSTTNQQSTLKWFLLLNKLLVRLILKFSFCRLNSFVAVIKFNTTKFLKMKKSIHVFVFAGLAILSAQHLHAQKLPAENMLMHTVIFSLKADSAQTANVYISRDEINPKAIHHFEKEFKSAKNVSWKSVNDGYVASYKSWNNKISVGIYYFKSGEFAGILKRYEPNILPSEIMATARDLYSGYSITYVSEASVAAARDEPTYILNLQKKDQVKVVRVSNDFSDVIFDSDNPGMPARF